MTTTLEKKTSVANTAALLSDIDGTYYGAVQNFFTVPIWMSTTNPPTLGPPSLCVPAADSDGRPGEFKLDFPLFGTWYYKTTVAGDFGFSYWPIPSLG